MYNEALKARFIRDTITSVSTAKQAELLFNAMAPYEESWGTDLCTVTMDELRVAVEQLAGVKSRSAVTRITLLKKYVSWCISHRIPGAINNVPIPESLGVSKVRATTVTSPLHLDKCLDGLFEDEECERLDNTYRCWMWLAYCGVPQNHSVDIKVADVNLTDRYVIYDNDRVVKLYDEAMPSITNCVKLKSFVYHHPNYSNDIRRDRVLTDYLLRGVRDGGCTELGFRQAFSRLQIEKKPSVVLTYSRIWLSGIFYRKKMFEDIGYDIDFIDEATEYVDGEKYKWNGAADESRRRRDTIMAVARDYMNDYRRWKLANY